jgi:hypothetical protein
MYDITYRRMIETMPEIYVDVVVKKNGDIVEKFDELTRKEYLILCKKYNFVKPAEPVKTSPSFYEFEKLIFTRF